MVQTDAWQVALLLGTMSVCAEWITDSAERADPASDAALADWAWALVHRLAAGAGAIVVEVNSN